MRLEFSQSDAYRNTPGIRRTGFCSCSPADGNAPKASTDCPAVYISELLTGRSSKMCQVRWASGTTEANKHQSYWLHIFRALIIHKANSSSVSSMHLSFQLSNHIGCHSLRPTWHLQILIWQRIRNSLTSHHRPPSVQRSQQEAFSYLLSKDRKDEEQWWLAKLVGNLCSTLESKLQSEVRVRRILFGYKHLVKTDERLIYSLQWMFSKTAPHHSKQALKKIRQHCLWVTNLVKFINISG